MDKKKLLSMVEDLNENSPNVVEGERILLIDSLNLFFRNFSMLSMVNDRGAHVGGLGGFFRSLGFLINNFSPTQVYVIFDGKGSSNNRKNLISEYKSGRNLSRITNWDAFDNQEEEDESKIDQIIRIIQYLKTLPVKTLVLDKVEADDIIAYISKTLAEDPLKKSIIVSSDKDYLQLISPNIKVYRPIEKEIYDEAKIIEKYDLLPSNFIFYKILLGDNSDKVMGIKGLGPKKINKLFPELSQRNLTLEDLFSICESKLKENVLYAKILNERHRLNITYRVMNLHNPLLSEEDKEYLNYNMESKELNFYPTQFIQMYKEDGVGNIIRNVDVWVKETFKNLK